MALASRSSWGAARHLRTLSDFFTIGTTAVRPAMSSIQPRNTPPPPLPSRAIATAAAAHTTAAAAQASPPPPPAAPKVGVGIVILRHLRENPRPEVLLIRRGKPPSKGLWSFCGGSLELGETLVECAIREAREETGLELRYDRTINPSTAVFSRSLAHPAVFAAVDVIDRGGVVGATTGDIRFHYAVVEVAAVPEDPRAEPKAADDADEARWWDVEALRELPDLVVNAVAVVEEALQRFEIEPS